LFSFCRQEYGVNDGAGKEGVDGRSDVGLDEEEEDFFVWDRKERRSNY
jgi:hypothetical protein